MSNVVWPHTTGPKRPARAGVPGRLGRPVPRGARRPRRGLPDVSRLGRTRSGVALLPRRESQRPSDLDERNRSEAATPRRRGRVTGCPERVVSPDGSLVAARAAERERGRREQFQGSGPPNGEARRPGRGCAVRSGASWGREDEGQRVLATLKLRPLLRWVKVARPAAGEFVFQPAIGLPAPARKLVKSAEAVPQSMFGAGDAVPAGRQVRRAAHGRCAGR